MEENAKGGGNRSDVGRGEGARHGGVEEDGEGKSGAHPEVGVADGTQIHMESKGLASRKEGER